MFCTEALPPGPVSPAPVISNVGAHSLTLSWTEPNSNGIAITGYAIYVQTGGSGSFIAVTNNTGSLALTFQFFASPVTKYAFKVDAVNVQTGAASLASATVTTLPYCLAGFYENNGTCLGAH